MLNLVTALRRQMKERKIPSIRKLAFALDLNYGTVYLLMTKQKHKPNARAVPAYASFLGISDRAVLKLAGITRTARWERTQAKKAGAKAKSKKGKKAA